MQRRHQKIVEEGPVTAVCSLFGSTAGSFHLSRHAGLAASILAQVWEHGAEAETS